MPICICTYLKKKFDYSFQIATNTVIDENSCLILNLTSYFLQSTFESSMMNELCPTPFSGLPTLLALFTTTSNNPTTTTLDRCCDDDMGKARETTTTTTQEAQFCWTTSASSKNTCRSNTLPIDCRAVRWASCVRFSPHFSQRSAQLRPPHTTHIHVVMCDMKSQKRQGYDQRRMVGMKGQLRAHVASLLVVLVVVVFDEIVCCIFWISCMYVLRKPPPMYSVGWKFESSCENVTWNS